MALHFSGRDKDGTHRISASSGHGGNVEGKRADYPFPSETQDTKTGYLKMNRVQPITPKPKPPAYTEVKYPISMNIDFHMGGYDFIGESIFSFSGDIAATDLNSISVYRNGLALDPDDYQINLNNNTITLRSPIMTTDDSLEIRANRCYRGAYAESLHDVLILKTSEHLIFNELSKIHPHIGETVDAQRIMKYKENKRIFDGIKHPFNTLEIVSYRVEPNGIYATLKSY